MINRTFIILWFYSLSWFCQASILEWQATGPTGGDIRELLMPEQMGERIFAASSYGIYHSRNSGRSWALFDRGLNGYSMNNLAWQASTQTLYAGSDDRGIFRRYLFDEYWMPINKDLPSLHITDIISTDTQIFISTDQGLFSSSDQGNNWNALNQGLADSSRLGNFSQDSQAQIYIATTTGVYQLDNNSQSWQAHNDGLDNINIDLLRSASDDSLYVVTPSGLYKRPAGSTNWQPRTTEAFIINGLSTLIIDRSNPQYLLASSRDSRLFQSQDSGQTWLNLGISSNNHDHIQSLIQDNNDNNLFYIGRHYSGIIAYDKNTDEPFKTDRHLNQQLTNTEITALASHPRNPRFMYAGIKGISLFISQDNGAQWRPIQQDFGQAQNADIKSILTFPNNENRVFVGTSHGHLYRSDDGGENWLDLGDLFESGKIYQMKTYGSPMSENIIVATANGLYKSDDNAQTWQNLTRTLTDQHITSLYFSPDLVLSRNFNIGTAQGHIYNSSDFGQTWERHDQGLADGEKINILTGSNRAPRALYAGTNSGLYYRASPNDTWEASSLTYPITDIKNDKANNSLMIAATTNGVFQSRNGGQNWRSLNNGLKNRHVLNIAISMHPLSIYAGTRGNGIYNLYDFSQDDFAINSNNSQARIDYTTLAPEAFALFDQNFVATLSPDTLTQLSAEQLNNFTTEAMQGLNWQQFENIPTTLLQEMSASSLSALPRDIIYLLNPQHIAALAENTLLELPPHELGRFISHLNPRNFSIEQINGWIPAGWSIDPNNLNLKAPVGAKLALPDLNRPDNLPPQIRLPRLPNLNKGIAMGGDTSTEQQILNKLNALLTQLQLPQYRFRQNEDGLLQVYAPDNPRFNMAFMIDINDIRQLASQAKPALTYSLEGKLQLSLDSQQRISLIPAPKDSLSLLKTLGGEQAANLRIGDAGDIQISYQSNNRRASQVHRVVVFDANVETVDDPAGVYDAEGESLLVVYEDGTAQLAYAAVPYPELLIETAYTFDGVEVVTCNTDGSCNLQYLGTNYRLSPDLDISVTDLGTEKIDPSIGINADGSLLYTVQDQSQALGVNLQISLE